MKEISKDKVCERADDLVGLLYGELSDWEARRFERHMEDCAVCKTEYAAFGQLRESIVAWRNEALGIGGERDFAPAGLRSSERKRPSALVALREFFNLSPLWLKGAAAFASVLLCVFATLAIARLIEKKNDAGVQARSDKVYTQQELDAKVEKLVRERTSLIEARQNNQTPKTISGGSSTQKVATRPATGASSEVANSSQKLRRPLSRQERQELAADLRLLTAKDDDGPDLVGDSSNQPPR